jgi:hypothetical protein
MRDDDSREDEIYGEKRARKYSNANSFYLERAVSGESAELFYNGIKEYEGVEPKIFGEKIENEKINFNKNKMVSVDLKEKIKLILANLYKSYQINRMNQENLMKRYDDLVNRQNLIEETIEKIRKVSKSKQKKHIKYLRYIPLSKIYYYSPKKTHFYYIFMDIVVQSRKKPLQIGEVLLKDGKNDDKLIKKANNRYKFKSEEDEILKKLILYSGGEYVNWYQLCGDFNDFIDSVLKSSKKPRTALELYSRSLEHSDYYTYKKWNTNEDMILKKAILYYGPKNWQQISYCLDGRNNSQCFHRWMKGINPKIKRSKWSFEEDLTLGIALKIYGNKKWSKIANHLLGRTDIQCRERFCNILDPSLEEVEWTPYEDMKLLMLYDKMKNKWSKIAKEFGNRTDNTCWRRWKYLETIRKSVGVYPNTISNQTNNTFTLLDTLSDQGADNLSMTISKTTSKKNKKNSKKIINDDSNLSKKKNKKQNVFLVEKVNQKETIETSLL